MSIIDGAKKIWKKTIFPDMIKNMKEKKAEEKRLREEARQEALKEAKPLLKEKYKQEELNKILGNKKSSKWNKLAKGFEGNGKSDMSKKISDAFSFGQSDDKISRMLGTSNKQVKEESPEERIKRMLR